MKHLLTHSLRMIFQALLLLGVGGAAIAAADASGGASGDSAMMTAVPAQPQYTFEAEFCGVWWWAEVDDDNDGYVSSANLDWRLNVVRSDGWCYDEDSLWVYEKLYWKSPDSITWHFYMTAPRHLIWGPYNHADHITISGFHHGQYDWKMEVYQDGTGGPDDITDVFYMNGTPRYPALYDYKMETAAEDVRILVDGYVKTGDGVPMEGVTMGGFPSSVITTAQGYYYCVVSTGWSGTITPTKACYTFSPTSKTYNSLTTSPPSQNYTASPKTVTISGYVRNSGGTGIAGVSLEGFPQATITDANGFYVGAVPCGWSGRITPEKGCANFTPAYLDYVSVMTNRTNQNYTGTTYLMVTISGSVKTAAGVGVQGVSMGGFPVWPPPTTDVNGNYSANVYCGSDVTITPMKDGYSFTPTSRSYTALNTSQTNQNFTAAYQTVIISGQVTLSTGGFLSGVIMDGLPGNIVTDSRGLYSVVVAMGWSGRVRAVKPGYSFLPEARTYSGIVTNQTGQNYSGTPGAKAISGHVRNSSGSGILGVTLRYLPGWPITDAEGFYYTCVPYGWTGQALPGKAGYTFTPTSRTYTNVISDKINQDYTGTQGTLEIAGYVTQPKIGGIAGVTMTGLPKPPVTDEKGFYTATVPYGWNGTILPTKSCYIFTPFSRTYTNLSADALSEDYSAAPKSPVISGTITDGTGQPLAGVRINGFSAVVTTDAQGRYSGAVTCGWTGTLTPQLNCYGFSPPSISFSNVTANAAGQNFTGGPQRLTITGYVRTAAGAGIAGVAMTGVPLWPYPETNVNGYYSLELPCGWVGEVAPVKSGYALDPPSRYYASLVSPMANQNFTGVSAVTIANAWWSFQVDRDRDGYTRSAWLTWDAAALLPDANPMVYEKVYYQPQGNPSWTLYATTTPHLCNEDPRVPPPHVVVTGLAHGLYEWKVEIYRNGASAPDYVRTYAADGDLRQTAEAPAQDAAARIIDARWSDVLDRDCDGAMARGSLWWNADVDPCEGSVQVYEKVYYRDQGGEWALMATTTTHPLTGCSATDTSGVVFIGFGSSRTLDWKIEIYRVDNAIPDHVCDTAVDADLNNVRFEQSGDDPQPTVSGTITVAAGGPLSGVTLDGFPGSPVITNAGGVYSWAATCGWSGTVTPRKSGYTFTPPSVTFTSVNSSRTQNFTATPTSVMISGTVKHPNGTAFAGVTMNGLPGPLVTDAGGYYAAGVSYGWSGTVTPAKENVLFDPPSRTYMNVLADVGGQDYVGAMDVRLKGTYTIGRNDAVFYNFAEAVNALMTNGIAGPVVFNVQSGLYNEQIVIGPIAGSTNINTVTFQSAGNYRYLDTVIYQASSPADNYVVKLDGADYVVFREITFIAAGTEYTRVFELTGDAQGNKLYGNAIIGTQRDSYDNALIHASGSGVDGTTISTNTITDGGYAIAFTDGDAGGGEVTSTKIIYNRALRVCHGVELESHYAPEMIANAFNAVTDGAVIHLRDCTGGIVIKGCFVHGLQGEGIWLENCPGDAETPGLMANNYIRTGTGSDPITVVRCDNVGYLDLYYNTVIVANTNPYSAALSMSDACRSNSIINNLLSCPNGAYVCLIDTAVAVDTMDYNDLYTPGNFLGTWGAVKCVDLAQWIAVTGKDAHSVSVNPVFTNPDGPFPQSPYLDGKAVPLLRVTNDYMSVTRDPLHPDIGAVEFAAAPEDMTPMSGTFEVGPGGGAKDAVGRVYATLSDVIADLALRGMDGPVIINLVDGVYDEQVVIPPIPGATLDANLTIQSQSGNAEGVVLSHTSWDPRTNVVIRLLGADHVTIKNMTIGSAAKEAPAQGRGIEMVGEVDNARILHNVFPSAPFSTDNRCAGIDMGNAGCTSRIIRWNHFIGGRGIEVALGEAYPAGIQITDNVFDDACEAIGLVRAVDPLVQRNVISCTDYSSEALFVDMCTGDIRISDNKIAVFGGVGLYLANLDPQDGAEALVVNNLIQCGSGPWDARGIFVSECRNLGIMHNSVHVTSSKRADGGPLYVFSGTGLRVIDNVFVNSGGTYAYHVASPQAIAESDYNDFYNGGNDSLIQWGGGLYDDVAAFSAANGKDQHSISANPCFYSATDLHARAMEVDGAGVTLAAMTTDIDGQPWDPLYPDLGADEFTYEPNTPPLAADDSVQTAMDSMVVIYILKNDHDPDGDPITVSAVTAAGHGVAAFVPGDSVVYYTPNPGFIGRDTFTYVLTDGRGCYDDTATVAVIVESITDVTVEGQIPLEFALGQNYPNPFNPRTAIEFSLPREAFVQVMVFNLLGQQVAILMDEVKQAGTYHLEWDGTMDTGEPAASGIYFYRLRAGEFVATRKMLLLK